MLRSRRRAQDGGFGTGRDESTNRLNMQVTYD